MAQLKVYTASAGSGKTHSLTKEYLSLVLKDKSSLAFKGVQAVTFTNKATEEMKSRILEELYLISQSDRGGKASAFFQELKKDLRCSDVELQERAKKVLKAILQDYSSFRIKTIDSFFQEVLRNLARELGLQGNFRPLVETKQIFEQAVLAILTDLDNPNIEEKDKTFVKQLVENLVHNLLQDGKSSDPRKEIKKLVSELAREEVQLFQEEGLLMSPDELKKYKKYCLDERKRVLKHLKAIADDVIEKLLNLGLFDENFESKELSYNRNGGFAPFVKLYERSIPQLLKDISTIDLLPARFEKALADNESLLKKDYRDRVGELSSSGIIDKMQEYSSFLANESIEQKLISINLILDFIDSYSFILKVDEKVKELQKEDNVILLKDTSRLINQMLKDKSGVYFLYEKLGTRILHHMIDEFQDTSRLQYENFKPLLEESLSNDNMSLVVGDVKQSIYRFRNSDSSLLRKDIIDDFGSEVKQINLASNWRSEAEIIQFNNALYEQLPRYISQSFAEKLKDLEGTKPELNADIFLDYYNKTEVTQAVGRKGQGGLVVVYPHEEMQKNDKNEAKEDECPSSVPPNFIETIANLQKRGYKPSDIAILVRRKAEASLVAEALSKEQEQGEASISYDFVSSEALELQNAQSVQFLIKVLSYIANPSSKLCRLQLRESYQTLTQGQSKANVSFEEDSPELETLRKFAYRGLYEALELIFEHYREIIPKSEVAYQIKFLDLAFSFQQNYTANIADFLKMYEERGATQTIVSPEDEQKLILMTAHKSKGLGFSVVLIPFASWSVKPKSSGFINNILWENAPFLNEVGIEKVKKIPIKYSSKLEKSLFARGMYEEQIRTALDELNLLYVATTRAKQELHLWYPQASKEGTVAHWLDTCFSQYQEGYITFDNEKTYEEQGITKQNELAPEKADASLSSIKIEQLESFAISERIAVLRQGLEHFEEDNPRLYGNMMHHILSNIITLDDIDEAVDSAVAQGLLAQNEANKTKQAIKDWLHSLDDYQRWFDGSAVVLNERAILGGADGLKRPDRVLIYDEGKQVEIVDYKFGKYSDRNNRKYEKQLSGYRKLLQEMNYKNVTAYIWYVREGLIKEIEP